jgi:hypothetical protein
LECSGGDLVQPDPLDELAGAVDHDDANPAWFPRA